MDSRDLTPEQLRALTERLRPMLGYLTRLCERMDAEGFPPHDKLLRTACEAQDRLQHLLTVLHYLGCPETTGRR
jgi:hypothetical protein